MRRRFVLQAVLGIFLIPQCAVCFGTETPDPNESSKYLDAVREFADNVLKYGRDTYGPKHTPLFVDGLNIHTHEPVKWIDPDGTKWILSNLASQQNLFRTLDGLTTITGDPKYKQAAVEAIEYVFANLRSPNGLLYWGASRAYDAQSDKVGGSGQHVLKANYPYYELMWQVNPDATKQFIEAFWSAHIMDWSNLEMNRIGPLNRLRVARGWEHEYKGGPVFFKSTGRSFDSTGADLNYAACILFKFTGQKEPLIWAKRLAHRYVETRDPKTGIGSYVFTLPKNATKHPLADDFAGHTVHMGSFFFTLGLGNPKIRQHILGGLTYSPGILGDPAFSSRICELLIGEVLGKDGTEFTRWAREELTAWGKVAYRKEDNSWIPMLSDGTSLEGYVCRTDIDGFGLKGDMLRAWKAGLTDLWAYTLAYRMTGDELMWEMARSIALGNKLGDIGKHSEEPQPNIKTTSSNAHALLCFLALYERTGKTEFLKMAQSIGDNILAYRFHHKFFVPSEKHMYAKLDALESVVLLHLYAALRPDCPSPPTVWPSRPRFQEPYRGIGIACDRALIYTVTESAEPPISLNEAAAMGNTESVESLIAKGTDVNNREHDFKTPLHRATISGHKDVVALLIAKGAQIDAKDSFPGGTALHYAAEKGHEEVAELLIIRGADVNAERSKYPASDTPLHSATRADRKDIIDLLVAKKADMNAKNDAGQTPLDIAVRQRNKEIADLLIEKGADVTSLHIAAQYGLLERLRELIERETDVNAKDTRGQTALHYAARKGHKEIVELLLENGADVNVGEKYYNRTAAEFAMWGNHNEIVELLVAKGADISPLHLAIYLKNEAEARSLIETGADINKRTPYGTTPLDRAVGAGLKNIVGLLIEKGTDVNAKDNWGWTPLLSAAEKGHRDLAELLIAKGANVNAREPTGETALHYAASNHHKEVAELLITKGADVSLKDKNGQTPLLSLPIAKDHKGMFELLQKHMMAHNIAVTQISVSSSCVKGDIIPIVVHVENQGDYDESCDIELTDVTEGRVIGRKSLKLPTKDKSGKDADLTITGESPGRQQFGNHIFHGDVNGNGYQDILVTASNYDNNRGRAYLYYGGLDMDAEPDKIFTGENEGDLFGERGSYLSDLNNDGFDEVIIGALKYNDGDGRVYIYRGGLDMDEEADLILDAVDKENYFGSGIATGDINNDGYDDLVVGARGYQNHTGRVYLYYGGDPFDTTADKTFTGENAEDTFGMFLSVRGDVDGDDCNDLLVGSLRWWTDHTKQGRAYLYYGSPGTGMDESPSLIFAEEGVGSQYCHSVDLFDIDNDGHADILIGARLWNHGQGRGYLYWGSNRKTMDNVPDKIFNGENRAAANLGGNIMYGGYVNDDEYGDIYISGYNYFRSDKRGRGYIYYGGPKASMDVNCDRIFTGYQASLSFGKEGKLADLNGDGYDDVILGAWRYNDFQGRVHVFYSKPEPSADITFTWNTTNASPGKHTLRATIGPVAGEEDMADNTMTVEVEVKERSK